MGDRVRNLFNVPAVEPASRRKPDVTRTALPLAPGIVRAVAEVRRQDEPGPRCASGSCPRRPAHNNTHCGVCARRGGDPVEVELAAAGWEPAVARGRRQGWRDPVTGEVLAARMALVIVRRDAAKGGPR